MLSKITKAPRMMTSKISKTKMAKGSTASKIAIGAAGVALAAGAVAAGTMLADKKTRSKLGKTAKDAFGTAQELATTFRESNIQQGYQAIGHQVGKTKGERYSRSGSKNTKKK